MVKKILEIFPLVEVIARHLYWRSRFFYNLANYLAKKSSKKSILLNGALNNSDFSSIANAMKDFGIDDGDILIIHSSYGNMRHFGLSPTEIIERLKVIVGDKGTIVMPSIPIFREEPKAIDRFKNELYEKPFTFNVKKTKTWTGALPQTLMKMKGAIRSRHPLNTIVALGHHAKEMTQNNLIYDGQLACGKDSSWAYCYARNAKILMIGVDVVHSLTMIHVAEDLFEDQWPVKNWYRDRAFRIIDGDFDKLFTLRERHPKWALFYAEKRFSKDLIKNNIITTRKIDGIDISLCHSQNLIDYLKDHKNDVYPYIIPCFLRKLF